MALIDSMLSKKPRESDVSTAPRDGGAGPVRLDTGVEKPVPALGEPGGLGAAKFGGGGEAPPLGPPVSGVPGAEGSGSEVRLGPGVEKSRGQFDYGYNPGDEGYTEKPVLDTRYRGPLDEGDPGAGERRFGIPKPIDPRFRTQPMPVERPPYGTAPGYPTPPEELLPEQPVGANVAQRMLMGGSEAGGGAGIGGLAPISRLSELLRGKDGQPSDAVARMLGAQR